VVDVRHHVHAPERAVGGTTGERKFRGGISLGANVGAGFPVGEFIGRAAFGVVAIVLDILVIIVWINYCRRLVRPETNSDT